MDLVKIKDTSSFAKDKETGAVVNINKTEARLARERKQRRIAENKRKEALESKVESLESDVSEIKELLTKVLEKL
jgi:hypothetical protein